MIRSSLRYFRPRLRLRSLLILVAASGLVLATVARWMKPGRSHAYVVPMSSSRTREGPGSTSWIIRNEGQAPLRLTLRGESSLIRRRYALVDQEIRVEPGGYVTLSQLWTRRGGSHPAPRSSLIETNDPGVPRIVLKSDGSALPARVLDPSPR